MRSSIPGYYISGFFTQYRDLFIQFGRKRMTFHKGDVIRQNIDSCSYTYFLLSGVAKVYITNANGTDRILGWQGENTLCFVDRVNEQDVAIVSLEAKTDIEVVALREEDFHAMGTVSPEFPYALLKYLGYLIRVMCADAEAKSLTDVESRLVSFLCMYFSNVDDDTIEITRDELAAAVNASRIQVTRTCSDLAAQGLISCGRGKITILDYDELLARSKV